MSHVISGLVLGILAVSAASSYRRFLYGVQPNDPRNLPAVLVLLSVAGAATFIPSRRASRIDPGTSLRQE